MEIIIIIICSDVIKTFFKDKIDLNFKIKTKTKTKPSVQDQDQDHDLFRLDALALSVIATGTWLAGWLGGWLAGCLSQPVLYQND